MAGEYLLFFTARTTLLIELEDYTVPYVVAAAAKAP